MSKTLVSYTKSNANGNRVSLYLEDVSSFEENSPLCVIVHLKTCNSFRIQESFANFKKLIDENNGVND